MKKILITGGAGFIGYHLAKLLLAHSDNEIFLIDNLQRGKMDEDLTTLLQNPRMRFQQADLTQPDVYHTFPTDFDHVYHLAAVNGTKWFYEMPHEVLRINTLSLAYILEWIKNLPKKPKFCFTSSNEAYAGSLEAFGQLPIPTPEAVPLVVSDTYNPRWTYAGTKLVGELFVIFYAEKCQFPAVIVRPHNFYGPRAGYDHVIPEWCGKVREHADPFVLFSPEETRTFCYIDDAVRAMAMLMNSEKTNAWPIETVHIGATDEITIGDLAERLFCVVGWRPSKIEVNSSPKGSVKRRCGDISKIYSLVGWRPEISLEAGLRRTYEWYSAHPKNR